MLKCSCLGARILTRKENRIIEFVQIKILPVSARYQSHIRCPDRSIESLTFTLVWFPPSRHFHAVKLFGVAVKHGAIPTEAAPAHLRA